MRDEMERLGTPAWDDADRDFARKIQATLSPEDIKNAYRRVGVKPAADQPLHDALVPLDAKGAQMIGSTDVGDVSWVVPTVQAHAATYAIGTPGHSWQLTAQGKSPAAHKGMVHVAKVMAATAVRAIEDPGLIARAKADLAERTAETPYVCPIPADVEPPLKAMALSAS
jgi:aminobenzoyl-glutamate utilization protein B